MSDMKNLFEKSKIIEVPEGKKLYGYIDNDKLVLIIGRDTINEKILNSQGIFAVVTDLTNNPIVKDNF
jgi:hypothetical protein